MDPQMDIVTNVDVHVSLAISINCGISKVGLI